VHNVAMPFTKIIFGIVNFFKKNFFEMSKFKEITKERKIQILMETQELLALG
jgi:hypothetical protein